MRRTSIMVCHIRCGAEENLRHPERSEGGGVVLKIAGFRSRQLGEKSASALISFPPNPPYGAIFSL